MPTYKEKLLDPRWQKKRLEILNRDSFTCQMCTDKESTLHIHHRRYIGGKDPWEYPDHLLVTLCASCHELEKEDMEESIPILIEQLKDKFFGNDVREIAYGFNSLGFIYPSEVMASAISWSLSNKKLMQKMLSEYFKHLQKTQVKVKNG